MLDSVRSSIIAATFRVNDRPNAKPNPDASSRDGSCKGFFELAVEHERERVKLARDEERQHDGLAGLRESLLGPVRRREFELWIHRDGNAAALVAREVELPADRSRPDAGLVTLSGLIGGGNRVLHDSRDQLLMCVL
jgi:hypothetical protein